MLLLLVHGVLDLLLAPPLLLLRVDHERGRAVEVIEPAVPERHRLLRQAVQEDLIVRCEEQNRVRRGSQEIVFQEQDRLKVLYNVSTRGSKRG